MAEVSGSVNSEHETHDSQKSKSHWRQLFKREGKDWQRDFKAKEILAKRLNHDLEDIRDDLRENAASLHRERQSSFYDAIRNLDDPKPMVRELLNEYDTALEEVKRLKDDCKNERRRWVDMQQQLRQKDEECGNSETKIRGWETYCNDLNLLKDKIEAERDTLQVEKEALERDNEEANTKHLSKVKELEVSYREKLSTVEQDLRGEKARHVEEIRDLNQKYSDDMRRKQTEHEGQIEICRTKLWS